MADSICHRGPDAAGSWSDGEHVALAHRRLSIIDLSEAGAQPMTSANGRWTITYNGEIYNGDDLRRRLRLDRDRLRGHSDTELLLEAIAAWGVPRTVAEVVGMFAFGAWDQHEKCLWLARDRFGEKPLYYTSQRHSFLFASELPAIEAGLEARPSIDRRAVSELLTYGGIRAPLSIYEGVRQLPPGSYLRVVAGQPTDPERYWDPVAIARDQPRRTGSSHDKVDEFEALLESAVRGRMVADVPLGAFLSGGTDSALVVAMMERVRPGTRTFTIGFEDNQLDESVVARRTAQSLGTIHEELIVTGEDALAVVPRLAAIYGEPFADASQIPTILVSEFTRRHVTVALSGDGGDELFGGYERYRYFERLLRTRRLPPRARRAVASGLAHVPVSMIDQLARSRVGAVLPSAIRKRPRSRLDQLATLLRSDTEVELYQHLRSVIAEPRSLIADAVDQPDNPTRLGHLHSTELAMMADVLDYLPNIILTKVDRAAMSVGLETRIPFLDPALFQFAWTLSPEDRVRNGHGKRIVRELLSRHVPREITELPKRGFGVPIDDWLRGPLRGWADDLLDPSALASQGLLVPHEVARRWEGHRSGLANLGPELWPILMLQSWLQDR